MVADSKLATVADFNYDELDEVTRRFVEAQTKEIHATVRLVARGVIQIGKKLNAVKDRLQHGQFLKWLHAEFDWSERTARNYMRVAQEFGHHMDKLGQLPQPIALKVLYMLSSDSVPEEVREEVIARAEAGEKITYHAARQVVDTFRQASAESTTLIHPDGADESISPDQPTSPRLTEDGHAITEDGVILRYVPGADRGWCSKCGDWRNFYLPGGQDLWACKVCGWRVSDDAMDIWEPPSGEATRESKRAQQRQARQRRAAAEASELAQLREEKRQWEIERAKLMAEIVELRAENTRLKARIILEGVPVEHHPDQPAVRYQ